MQVLYNVEVVFDQTEQACDVWFHYVAPNEGTYVIVFDALWMLENGWKKCSRKTGVEKKLHEKQKNTVKQSFNKNIFAGKTGLDKKWTQNIEIITLKKRFF